MYFASSQELDWFMARMNLHSKWYNGIHQNNMNGTYSGVYTNFSWIHGIEDDAKNSPYLGFGLSFGKARKLGNFVLELEGGLGIGIPLNYNLYADADNWFTMETNIYLTFFPSFVSLNIGYQF
jgi:hypothetical protein